MPEISLAQWYSSEYAKRRFGPICFTVHIQETKISLLGNEQRPLLILADIDAYPEEPGDIEIGVGEATMDWSAVITAASLFGTRFRIRGKGSFWAILFKHPRGRHPAERYRRASSVEVDRLADQLEEIAKEVRGLRHEVRQMHNRVGTEIGERIGGKILDHINEVVDRMGGAAGMISRAADIFDRRIPEIWRSAQGLPPLAMRQ